MTTATETILGTSDLPQGLTALSTLPNGDIIVEQYFENGIISSKSTIEILQPGASTITNVTAQLSTGSLLTNINSVNINEVYVGSNTLPDIFFADQGLDGATSAATYVPGQLRVLVPVNGKYVDETSLLPQVSGFNHRVSTGTINGHTAIIDNMVGDYTHDHAGVELLIANSDGTFTDWSSHLPANISSVMPLSTYAPTGYGSFLSSAIADITGSGAGDIFIGGDHAEPNNLVLVNNGQGYFTTVTVTAAKPTFADGGKADAVFELATKFQGDTHTDMIVAYADETYATNSLNPTGNGYFLQFLKGDGTGNFTDVTSLHLTSQPKVTNAAGQNEWVSSVQQVNINGNNDLVLYLSSSGSAGTGAILLANDGHDNYSQSTITLPNNLLEVTWGTDNGVGGFYGLNASNQWVFVPISTIAPVATSITMSGAGSTIASNLDALQADMNGGATLNITITDTAPVLLGGGKVPLITATVAQLTSDAGALGSIMTQNAHSAVETISGGSYGWVQVSSNGAAAITSLANLENGVTTTLTGLAYGDELIFSSSAEFVANTPAAGLGANYVTLSSITTNVSINVGTGVGFVSVYDVNGHHTSITDVGSSARYDVETASATINLSSSSSAKIELNDAWYGERDLTVTGWVSGKDHLSLSEPGWQGITSVAVLTASSTAIQALNATSSHAATLIQLGSVGAGDAATVAAAAAAAYHPSTTGTDAYGVYFAGTTSTGSTTVYAFLGDAHGTITASDLIHAVTLAGVSSISATDLVAS